MKARLFLALAMSMSLGCQFKGPTSPAGKLKPGASVGAPAASARVVDFADLDANAPVKVSGLARIISDNGLGIISNNGGAIISDNGSGLISNNGGSYRVAAAAAPESPLADAVIEIYDAQGARLTDRSQKPITVTTDQQGRYQFAGVLPRENLILRIRLWNGGVLTGILTTADGEADGLTLNLDTATSLGAAYVLEQYVKQQQRVLDRLPRAEAEKLTAAIEAARGELAGTPSYRPADLVTAAAALRQKAPAVDQSLERIEAILLAGQKDLGNGLPATQVPLSGAQQVVGDDDGNLYIIESAPRRIRRVGRDGIISTLALKGEALGNPTSIVRAKDGSFYVACPIQLKVQKVAPDGTVSTVLGDGTKQRTEPAGRPGRQVATEWGVQLALAPDGTVYLGEVTKGGARAARLLALAPDGTVTQVPTDGAIWTTPDAAGDAPSVSGMAVGADGTLYAAQRYGARLIKRAPGGSWQEVAGDFRVTDYSGVAIGADGTVYGAATSDHVVWAFGPDGARRLVAGQRGQSGAEGDGGPAAQARLNAPLGLWVGPDGTLYIVDGGNGLVRAVDRAGMIRTVAGATGLSQQGEVASLGVNGPSGMALDPRGRLVIAESGTATVKRLEGTQLSVVMGSSKLSAGEPNGDGGPAGQARFIAPGHLAYHGDTLYVMDAGAATLRRVGADGIVRAVAGDGSNMGLPTATRFPAIGPFLRTPSGLAISPEGVPFVADATHSQIYRVVGGEAEIVAGALGLTHGYEGDGGPAAQAKLSRPSALAFDAEGHLYVADSGNLVIRRIAKDGTISTIAGLGLQASLLKLLGFRPGADEGAKATESAFVVPMGLAFDAEGNLYVAEAGTSNVDLLGAKLPLPAALIPKIGARVRKIAKDGTVTTVVGPGGKALTDGELLVPLGLLVDREGRLLISDGAANQVWMLPKGAF